MRLPISNFALLFPRMTKQFKTKFIFMKNCFFSISALLFSLLITTSFQRHHETEVSHGFAVVELFTSEGCSSCPAADEAVIDIAKQYKQNVFILGFHVDYWNYLGWKDAFSNADYSGRQKQYASLFSLNSIYTPQIVVNGKSEFVGSDKSRLQKTIEKELSNNMAASIELSAKETDGKKVMVNYKTENLSNSKINIAIVQLYAQSNVAKGENQGRQLRHINIVRDFKTVDATGKQNAVYLNIPAGLSKKDCMVIAYVQDKNNMHITDAAEVSIQ